jgi:Fe2+ or Zn2+ uptake regulation protein
MKYPSHLKKTKSRLAVFDYLLTHDESFSVDELHQQISDIHIATLYRIVEEFEKENLIRLSDDFNPSVRRYQKKHHKHQHKIKCVDCGEEVTLESCPLHIHAPDGFILLDHRIELIGLCKSCAEKRKHV